MCRMTSGRGCMLDEVYIYLNKICMKILVKDP